MSETQTVRVEARTVNSSRTRRWPVAMILLFLGVAQGVIWLTPLAQSPTERIMGTIWATLIVIVLLMIWAMFFAGFGPNARSVWLFGLTVLGVGVFFSAHIDGYTGDATPIRTWRWQSSTGVSVTNLPGPIQGAKLAEPAPFVDLRVTSANDFLGFQGVDRSATLKGTRLSRDWETQPPQELWRRPVGAGWSSFAIVGDHAVTQEQHGPDEAIVCYDLRTGNPQWTYLHKDARFSETYGGDGPRGTPTIDRGRVFSLGATGQLICLDGAGNEVWSTNILVDTGVGNLAWGMSGSPLVYDDYVVVNPGGPNGHSVVAYHRDTGKIAWNAGDGQAGYSSPMLVTLGGVRQIVLLNGPALEGYAADGSGALWRYPWVVNGSTMVSASQPVVMPSSAPDSSGRIFISSGYGQGCVLLELRYHGGTFEPHEIWPISKSMKTKFSTPVRHGEFMYGLDGNLLACVSLADGERQWKGGRYGYGQILLVDDLIIVQAENGDVALVAADPETHHELGRFSPFSSKTWNAPALSGRYLLVRNDREAACYELPIAD